MTQVPYVCTASMQEFTTSIHVQPCWVWSSSTCICDFVIFVLHAPCVSFDLCEAVVRR